MDNKTIGGQLMLLQWETAALGKTLSGFWQQLTLAIEGGNAGELAALIEQIITMLSGLEGLQIQLTEVRQMLGNALEIPAEDYVQLEKLLADLDSLHQESSDLLLYHDSLLQADSVPGSAIRH